jgi:hypothetical protein
VAKSAKTGGIYWQRLPFAAIGKKEQKKTLKIRAKKML